MPLSEAKWQTGEGFLPNLPSPGSQLPLLAALSRKGRGQRRSLILQPVNVTLYAT